MAKDYFTSIVNLCGLLKKQISFPAETENDRATNTNKGSVKAEHRINVDSAGFSATYKTLDSTDGGKGGFVVDAVKDDSVANGFGLKEGDWLYSGNDSKFSTVEDITNFFNSLPHENQSVSLKIMRETHTSNSTGASSQYETVVLSKTDNTPTVSVINLTDVASQLNEWFQPQYIERFYIRWYLDNSYVWVKRKNLTLKSRVRRRNKNLAIFKLHHFRENFDCTDSAIPVVLEHEQSGQWVSLTKTGVTMRPAQDMNTLTPDNTCMFKLVRESAGMNFVFKSYHLKRAGQVYFLGFQRGDRSVTPIKGSQGPGQRDIGPETTVFTLFSAR